MSDPLIRIRNLSKIYNSDNGGEVVVFDNLNLDIRRGEIVCIVGPSGCGKTTLLDIILGVNQATTGTVEVDGKLVTGQDRHRGIISQGIDLYPDLRVMDHVIHGPLLEQTTFMEMLLFRPSYFRKRNALKQRAQRYLEAVGLSGKHIRKFPSELSGGMQQRLAIASAMMMDHKVLLMDEFTSKLDEGIKQELQIFGEAEIRRAGTTAIIVTHSLVEALFIGDRVLGLTQHYLPRPGEEKRGARIVTDIKVPGSRPRDPKSKDCEDLKKLRQKIHLDVLDEGDLIPVSDFDLSHPDAWTEQRARAGV